MERKAAADADDPRIAGRQRKAAAKADARPVLGAEARREVVAEARLAPARADKDRLPEEDREAADVANH